MDETREQIIRDRAMREHGRPVTREDVHEATLFRAQLARIFYGALMELGFNHADAVTITAGQHF